MKKRGQVSTVKLVIGVVVAIIILIVATGVLYGAIKLFGGEQQSREEKAAVSNFNSLAEALENLKKRTEKFAYGSLPGFGVPKGFVITGNSNELCLFEEAAFGSSPYVPCRKIEADFYVTHGNTGSWARSDFSIFVGKSHGLDDREFTTNDFDGIFKYFDMPGKIWSEIGYARLVLWGSSGDNVFPTTTLHLEKIDLPGKKTQLLVLPERIESRKNTIKDQLETPEYLKRLAEDPDQTKFYPIYVDLFDQYKTNQSETLRQALDVLLERRELFVLAYGKDIRKPYGVGEENYFVGIFWVFNLEGKVWTVDEETKKMSLVEIGTYKDVVVDPFLSKAIQCVKDGRTWNATSRNCTGEKAEEVVDEQEAFQEAMNLFDQGSYAEAIQKFIDFKNNFPESEAMNETIFYLGWSYLKKFEGEYPKWKDEPDNNLAGFKEYSFYDDLVKAFEEWKLLTQKFAGEWPYSELVHRADELSDPYFACPTTTDKATCQSSRDSLLVGCWFETHTRVLGIGADDECHYCVDTKCEEITDSDICIQSPCDNVGEIGCIWDDGECKVTGSDKSCFALKTKEACENDPCLDLHQCCQWINGRCGYPQTS